MPPEDFSERIDLIVNDENRIVSYKVLSYELKIHVNKAKQCLLNYYNEQKLKGISLGVNYFLAGFVETDGVRTVKVAIVPEDKLESVKETFSELTSFHIYSLYRTAIKDQCALYSTDFTFVKNKEHQIKYSAIKHPNIEIQPPVLNKIQVNDVKVNITKKVSQAPTICASTAVDPKKDLNQKVVQNGASPEKSDNLKEQVNESNGKKTTEEEKKQKAGTLMSMWQKKEEKPNGLKKESLKVEVKGKVAAKNVPKNNIMSMFSKQAVKNAEKPPVVKLPASKDDEKPKTVLPDVIEKEDLSKSEKPKENKKVSQKRKIPNKNSKQSSKSKRDSDSENEFEPKTKKKHRRICTFDSSSDSEPEEEREKAQRSFFLPEDPLEAVVVTPMSEDEEPIPPTPPVINVKGRSKMWKTVQKTFEDEDGFFVTKTEKELVSASEDEEDPIKVEPIKKEEEVVNKKSISVHKKQASLMSFFKQK